jgi:hypothetical protein
MLGPWFAAWAVPGRWISEARTAASEPEVEPEESLALEKRTA